MFLISASVKIEGGGGNSEVLVSPDELLLPPGPGDWLVLPPEGEGLSCVPFLEFAGLVQLVKLENPIVKITNKAKFTKILFIKKPLLNMYAALFI
jgi:hypothetical protein